MNFQSKGLDYFQVLYFEVLSLIAYYYQFHPDFSLSLYS